MDKETRKSIGNLVIDEVKYQFWPRIGLCIVKGDKTF